MIEKQIKREHSPPTAGAKTLLEMSFFKHRSSL